MKKIIDLLDSVPEIFNNEEPREGHLDRFEQKLNAQNRRIMFRRRAYNFIKIAAIVIIVVFSAVLIKYKETENQVFNVSQIGDSREMKEAEQFYSRQLQASYDNIKKIKFPDENQKKKLLEEVSKKDDSYAKIKEDLQKDPSNEMVQQAMINYYETRLEAMNQIVANLKEVLHNNS